MPSDVTFADDSCFMLDIKQNLRAIESIAQATTDIIEPITKRGLDVNF